MDALGTQDIATHFPLVDGDDFLNLLNLDVDEIGDDTESLNPTKASFSNSCSSASGGGGGGGGEGGEGGVASSPTDEEEDLEWLTNKDAFPALEFNILDDKPAGMGFLGQQHSPVSVLESIVVNGNGDIISSSSADNRASRGTLQVPTGFPGYTRKKRFGRKPRICFSQDKHLSLVGEQVNDVIQPVKIVRKNRASTVGRRCSHCFSDKTPQWRTGPMGKKTLCNACGVRYKSGRLVPEYRPANSPTFSSVLHSNSHRKIVEMRRQKQAGEGSSI